MRDFNDPMTNDPVLEGETENDHPDIFPKMQPRGRETFQNLGAVAGGETGDEGGEWQHPGQRMAMAQSDENAEASAVPGSAQHIGEVLGHAYRTIHSDAQAPSQNETLKDRVTGNYGKSGSGVMAGDYAKAVGQGPRGNRKTRGGIYDFKDEGAAMATVQREDAGRQLALQESTNRDVTKPTIQADAGRDIEGIRGKTETGIAEGKNRTAENVALGNQQSQERIATGKENTELGKIIYGGTVLPEGAAMVQNGKTVATNPKKTFEPGVLKDDEGNVIASLDANGKVVDHRTTAARGPQVGALPKQGQAAGGQQPVEPPKPAAAGAKLDAATAKLYLDKHKDRKKAEDAAKADGWTF